MDMDDRNDNPSQSAPSSESGRQPRATGRDDPKKHPFGLYEIVSGGPNPTFDCVAVHGFDGHREDSWTHKKSGKMWLRDFLPKDIPNCRILTFGYDTAPVRIGKTATPTFLRQHAQDLVAALVELRGTADRERPIMFIGHSLGGIIIKHALLISDMARKNHNEEYRSIKVSTFAVLTFGTPHRGAHGATLQATLLKVLNCLPSISANSNVAHNLSIGSEHLWQLDLDYAAIKQDFKQVFFCETLKTLVAGKHVMIVDLESAASAERDSVTVRLSKDHISIVKYDQEDDDYKKVVTAISNVVQFDLAKVASRNWPEEKTHLTGFGELEEMRKTVSDSYEDSLLEKLVFVQQAQFFPRRTPQCLKGTRAEMIERIIDWATAKSSPQFLWLYAHAGWGKSSLVGSIAALLQIKESNQLGAYYAFSRSNQITCNIGSIFSSVALQLANSHPSRHRALVEALKSCAVNKRTTTDPQEQFERFVSGPCSQVHSDAKTTFIIFDGIDELDTEEDKDTFIEALSSSPLPSNIRVILVSRPDSSGRMAQLTDTLSYNLASMVELSSNISDILKYISERNSRLRQKLSDAQMQDLAAASDGLFQWAAISMNILQKAQKGRDSTLRELLSSKLRGDLDSMYQVALNKSLELCMIEGEDPTEALGRLKSRLGRLLVVKEAVTLRTLVSLRSTTEEWDDDESDTQGYKQLSSLLLGVENEDGDTVRPLHASLREFLLKETIRERQLNQFFVDTGIYNYQMLLTSLDILNNRLEFNIAQVESSYYVNTDPRQSHQTIASDIVYASIYWCNHISSIEDLSSVTDSVLSLLTDKLLFWFEVLSIQGTTAIVPDVMDAIINEKTLHHVALHAKLFYLQSALPISLSVPHIYISALTFVPKSSAIYKNYFDMFGSHNILLHGAATRWSAEQVVLRGHDDFVRSVAFSPDGTRVVSGSDDKTVRIWDAVTGEQIGDPLVGHEHWVQSVSLSPDGTWIVSGSHDKTVRMWDAFTGEQIGDAFIGHEDSVNSVAFSLDGARIVSGSRDKTVRVWDATTGRQIGDPFTGHEDLVTSVAFSPYDAQIVSGSWDKTVRIWDATTGRQIGDPFTGHEGLVSSVAFSPDGTRIVSGSHEENVLMWDAYTGEQIGDAFIGHEDSVHSVAFSPDGTRIVSGSYDETARIWVAVTDEQIGDAFIGHESWVNSVAFSPDGSRIVSGSHDETIRIWSTVTGEQIGDLVGGYGSLVRSVALSPDGTRIVSGHGDKTVRIWDVVTGEQIGNSLVGHEDSVYSAAFSPDGARILSGSRDKTVRIWDAATGRQIGDPFTGHEGLVTSVAFSLDGIRIVSGSNDNTVRMWNASTGKQIGDAFIGHEDSVNSVAFSVDGARIVSGSSDETVRMWDASTGEQIGDAFICHEDSVNSVAFSPDGTRIVSGSGDRTVRIWDVVTGQQIGDSLVGHDNWVSSVSFSPDGTRIVSGSRDQTVRIWDVATGDLYNGQCIGHGGSTAIETTSRANVPTTPAFDAIAMQTGTPVSWLKEMLSDSNQITSAPPLLRETKIARSAHSFNFHHKKAHLPKTKISPRFTMGRDDLKWINGPDAELLLWVPPRHSNRWYDARSRDLVIGRNAVRLDLSSLVQGSEWATLIRGDRV